MSTAKPVRVCDEGRIPTVAVVGCGGTGGYIAASLMRLIYGIKEHRSAPHRAQPLFGHSGRGYTPAVLLMDGGSVEAANALRQSYTPDESGANKAISLVERYSPIYGLQLGAYPYYIEAHTDLKTIVPEGSVVVGALDNAAGRRALHDKLMSYKDAIYLDCGNAAVSAPPPKDGQRYSRCERLSIESSGWEGQVVAGVRADGETVLPFPAEVFPDLLEEEDEARDPEANGNGELSCEELTAAAPQRGIVNLWAATVALSYINTLLTEGTLINHRSLFDARRGYVRSVGALEVLEEVSI